MRSATLRRTFAAGAAVTGMLLVTACSAEDIAEKATEKVVEDQLGDGADVDVDTDNGEVRIDDGDGNSYVSGDQLPDDFPDEIPLVDGTILSGVAVDEAGGRGWSVAVQVDTDAQGAVEEAARLLEEAGFELVTEIQAGVPGAQLTNDTWGVVIAAYEDTSTDTAVVGYTVGDNVG
ncbi:hypothetical protein ACFQ0K_09870 [Nocardioides caeni]|uniref:PASTA domain-containing protein n=1 Tax=Nocardioides caeni TaxID=574700 RepID=A0A4S8N534_9ACTN|nr:hypothetical protein [Nocardioides caeni]THV11220.1 hypothetical protein E9934_13090 [Nocardioides caeni]